MMDADKYCGECGEDDCDCQLEKLQAQIAALLAVIEAKEAALEKIACVGNGNSHGNSVGNCMAIEALAAKRETE